MPSSWFIHSSQCQSLTTGVRVSVPRELQMQLHTLFGWEDVITKIVIMKVSVLFIPETEVKGTNSGAAFWMSPHSLCVTLGMFLNFLHLWGLLCNMENCNSPHRVTLGIKHTGIKELRELLKNSEHSINTYLRLRNVVISSMGFSVCNMGIRTKQRS